MAKSVSQSTLNKYRKNVAELKKAEEAFKAKKQQQEGLKAEMAQTLGFEVLAILQTDDFEIAFESIKHLKRVATDTNIYDQVAELDSHNFSGDTAASVDFVKQAEHEGDTGNGQTK